jgi:hypothetical protein
MIADWESRRIRAWLVGLLATNFTASIASLLCTAQLGQIANIASVARLVLLSAWLLAGVVGALLCLMRALRRKHLPIGMALTYLSLIPALAIASWLGQSYRRVLFEKHRHGFMELVTALQESSDVTDGAWYRAPDDRVPEGALWAMAQRTNDYLVVKFYVSGQFPARHFGYIYVSNKDVDVSVFAGNTEAMPENGWFEYVE